MVWPAGGLLGPNPTAASRFLATLVVADYKLPWPHPGRISQKVSLDPAALTPPVVL